MIELKEYRDTWLLEKSNDVIGFYTREFYCLDNFSSFKVKYDGYLYSTVEEAYQSLKFKGVADEVYNKIISSYSADEALRIARKYKALQRPDWDNIKVGIMEQLLRNKLEQNPYVKKKLPQTGNYTIVEDSTKDDFWGWGKDRTGQNQLGKIWIKLRLELQETK